MKEHITCENFDYELLDTETGVTYKSKIYVAVEENVETVLNDDYDSEDCRRLQHYFYVHHHCSCHRHSDAVITGLNESSEDFECAGNRFQIASITIPGMPEVTLYSETMSGEELQDKLDLLKPKRGPEATQPSGLFL